MEIFLPGSAGSVARPFATERCWYPFGMGLEYERRLFPATFVGKGQGKPGGVGTKNRPHPGGCGRWKIFGVPGLLGGLEGLRHLRGVLEHVANFARVHLCDNLFRDTESDEAAAMLELATTLGAGFLARTDFVGFDLGAIDGHGGKWMG